MKRVVFLTQILTHYRVPFHLMVRDFLGELGIDYALLYGQPNEQSKSKNEEGNIPWAREIHNSYFNVRGIEIVYQPALSEIFRADLVVIGQENKFLINYLLISLKSLGLRRPQIAFFGHGKNFQASHESHFLERWKRFWSTHVDWWFAYTEASRQVIVSNGFCAEQVTVVQNSIDTAALTRDLSTVTEADIASVRDEFGLTSSNIAVFVGSLYHEKRIDFLIESAVQIRAALANFELVIVGNGPEEYLVEQARKRYPWIKYASGRRGREKATILKASRLVVVPGLVGLGILDAFVAGLPVVITDCPWHSPEYAYFRNNYHGLLVTPWTNRTGFSDAVIKLLSDQDLRDRFSANCLQSADQFTIEQMAQNFVSGVRKCLSFNTDRSGQTFP